MHATSESKRAEKCKNSKRAITFFFSRKKIFIRKEFEFRIRREECVFRLRDYRIKGIKSPFVCKFMKAANSFRCKVITYREYRRIRFFFLRKNNVFPFWKESVKLENNYKNVDRFFSFLFREKKEIEDEKTGVNLMLPSSSLLRWKLSALSNYITFTYFIQTRKLNSFTLFIEIQIHRFTRRR